jgi:hypothetical protein
LSEKPLEGTVKGKKARYTLSPHRGPYRGS